MQCGVPQNGHWQEQPGCAYSACSKLLESAVPSFPASPIRRINPRPIVRLPEHREPSLRWMSQFVVDAQYRDQAFSRSSHPACVDVSGFLPDAKQQRKTSTRLQTQPTTYDDFTHSQFEVTFCGLPLRRAPLCSDTSHLRLAAPAKLRGAG